MELWRDFLEVLAVIGSAMLGVVIGDVRQEQ